MSPDHNAAPTDFDAIKSRWRVAPRRLNARLAGCTGWTSFSGTPTTRKVLERYGNVEDDVLDLPDGPGRALALRSFDPASRRWAIWWPDGRSLRQLDVPVIGGFSDSIGELFADDTLAGRPSPVRFRWHPNPGADPRWEQPFSSDGGATWETNWTMDLARVGD